MHDSIPVNIVLKDKSLVHFLQDDISMFTMPDEPQGGGAWIRLCVWRNVAGDNGNILIPSNQLYRLLFFFFFLLPYLLKSKPFFHSLLHISPSKESAPWTFPSLIAGQYFSLAMCHQIGCLEETQERLSFPRVPTSEGDLFVMFKVCFSDRLTLLTWQILKWVYPNLSLCP